METDIRPRDVEYDASQLAKFPGVPSCLLLEAQLPQLAAKM